MTSSRHEVDHGSLVRRVGGTHQNIEIRRWVSPTLPKIPPCRKSEVMHEELIIPLAGIMLPMVLVPSIILLVHRQKKREWHHQERLRAIEMGLPAPPPDRMLGGGTVVAIGAGVPIASVFTAWMTTISVSDSHPEYIPIIAVAWGCAFMISTGALITSLVLGVLLMRSRKPAELVDQLAAIKPAYEPDAYDVVSRRG
jgi:hypothetical protein